MEKKDEDSSQAVSSDDKVFLGIGAGVGIYGAILAVTTGVICPACVIAAPALIGAGLYVKFRNRNKKP